MIYLLFSLFFMQAQPLFSFLDLTPKILDLTPIAWNENFPAAAPYIYKEADIFHLHNPHKARTGLNVVLPEDSILDCIEEKFESNNSDKDFQNIKQKRLDNLTKWFLELNFLPDDASRQESFNNQKNNPLLSGPSSSNVQRPRKCKTPQRRVLSTLEKPYRGQAILYRVNRTTGQHLEHGNAFFFRKNAALTAANCVYDLDTYEETPEGQVKKVKSLGWPENCDFLVYPAYNNSHAPFKGYHPKQIFIPAGWKHTNRCFMNDMRNCYRDFAVLIFDENIGEFTGCLGLLAISNVLAKSLQQQETYMGQYTKTADLLQDDEAEKNTDQEIEKDSIGYAGKFYKIKRIVEEGRVLRQQNDNTPGQEGSPIILHSKNINYKQEPYAIAIRSKGFPRKNGETKNYNTMITEEVMNWALEVSNPYQLPGQSVYDLTFPKIVNAAKRHTNYIDKNLADPRPNSILREYRNRWANILSIFTTEASLSDQDWVRLLHKHIIKKSLTSSFNDFSALFTAYEAEKKLKFAKARALCQMVYEKLITQYSIQEYTIDDNINRLARNIPFLSEHAIFRLGVYYLRGLGGEHNVKKAYWLFLLSKHLNHFKGKDVSDLMTKLCDSRKISILTIVNRMQNFEEIKKPTLRGYSIAQIDDVAKLYRLWGLPSDPDRNEMVYSSQPFLEYIKTYPNQFDNTYVSKYLKDFDRLTRIPMNYGYKKFIHDIDMGIFSAAPNFSELLDYGYIYNIDPKIFSAAPDFSELLDYGYIYNIDPQIFSAASNFSELLDYGYIYNIDPQIFSAAPNFSGPDFSGPVQPPQKPDLSSVYETLSLPKFERSMSCFNFLISKYSESKLRCYCSQLKKTRLRGNYEAIYDVDLSKSTYTAALAYDLFYQLRI